MNNNDIVRNASVIMNHYERHRRHTELRGKKNLMHIVKRKKTSVSQSSTHRQPIEKEDNAWSTTAGQTHSNNK